MPGPRTPCSSRTMPSALTLSHRSFTRASECPALLGGAALSLRMPASSASVTRSGLGKRRSSGTGRRHWASFSGMIEAE